MPSTDVELIFHKLLILSLISAQPNITKANSLLTTSLPKVKAPVSERPSKTPFTTHLSKIKKSSRSGWPNCGITPRQDSRISQTTTTQKPRVCRTLFPCTMQWPTPASRCKESIDGGKRGNRLFHCRVTTSGVPRLLKATHRQTTAHKNQWPTSAKTKTSLTSSKKCNSLPHRLLLLLLRLRMVAVRLSTGNTRPC